MVEITAIIPSSLAEKAGICAGDILVSINGHHIRDVLDYRFRLTEKQVEIECERNGERLKFNISKDEYGDIGLEFERPLMDKKLSCANKCVFCFIDQLPRGMRKTLYFKDDDSRLSFLHGNYVTLTNMDEADIDRIIEMHISPVNISVHTTNPELRVQMMKNKRAGEVLSYLEKLADHGIALCTQIVLCKGLNDGEELVNTMHDLATLHPALKSCSIVPAGLTKFRDGLYPLSPFTPEECGRIIDTVNNFGGQCLDYYGSRLFFCADELYLKAGRPLPSAEYYEDYSQIENGVGMITSLETDFNFDYAYISDYSEEFEKKYPNGRTVSIATGEAAYGLISRLARKIEDGVPKAKINVYAITNHFFGESITVSGLLTGSDMAEQLAGRELGEMLYFPKNTLKADEDIFLDDMTPSQLSEKLGVPVSPSSEDGFEFIPHILGLDK
ncbi:MAG: DUF512 domain-containing protein [Clostridia bacterium]|nr:DUF512 domain-containing protein [Clostridia bacterium]